MISGIEWNKFIIENSGGFLQSWEWGKFQELLGRKIWRLGDGENWAALVIKHDLPLGKNYLYCPGPIISKLKTQNSKPQLKCQNFLNEVKEIAEQEKSIFLKIEPFWVEERILDMDSRFRGNDNKEKFYFKKSGGGQRILKTLVLDLNQTEEELLTEMKQKTRYNIKVAEKNGVKIRVSASPKNDFKEFWRLMAETAKRNKIKIHSREHYEKLLSVCHLDSFGGAKDLDDGNNDSDEISSPSQARGQNDRVYIKLFLAEYNNKIIAANIVVFFGNRMIYLHGASDYERRHLMAPYLLQWEQIKGAKKRGCEVYDFWGIDEAKWPGITRFKKGFGGKEISYIGTFDYVFDRKWYKLYRLAKKILLG